MHEQIDAISIDISRLMDIGVNYSSNQNSCQKCCHQKTEIPHDLRKHKMSIAVAHPRNIARNGSK
ncbi:MAG TPA: hypothetical protein VIN05_05345 [Roseovarius sp.]|uniref:hypothetical protein n=1 Tax=Roseovarius sp. M141 TaxID=2583806 RepID=UPI0020CBBABE|nr:hypothetical protein [Roseovarius sp. M141]MCQ0090419.1 hypothetical protein [Roseovarius sp. M141]